MDRDVEIASLRTRQEELRLDRAKLLLSRNGMMAILWMLLAAIDIAAVVAMEADNAITVIVLLGIIGFIASLMLIKEL